MSPRRIALPLLSALALLAAACGGGSSDPTPTATQPPAAGQTVTPATAPNASVLAQAAELYDHGYFEDALEMYEAAADVPALRADALWPLAVAQFQRGMRSQALESIDALLEEEIDGDLGRRARLLAGVIQASRGRTEEAREPLQAYIDAGGPAAPYATLRLAQIATREDDIESAIALSNGAIAEGLPPGVQTSTLFAIAEYQERANDAPGAIATYSGLSSTAHTASGQAEALWRMAELAHSEGFTETARLALVRLAVTYPASGLAVDALSHPALTSGVSTLDRANVLYFNRLNEDAADAFEAFLAEEPPARDAARAHHRLGIISERFGDYEQALVHYDTAIELLAATPADEIAADAMWDRALVLHVLGRLDEAVGAYLTLSERAPNSPNVQDALFAAGLVRYQQGLPGSSFDIWERYRDSPAAGPASVARAEFWLGKAWDALGDQVGAAARHYQAAVDAAPHDYYGLRARAILDDTASLPDGPPDESEPDWAGLEAWLESVAGPEDTADTAAFFGERWERALELIAIGLVAEADEELIALRDSAIGDPWRLYRLARAADDEGIDWLTSRAAGIIAGSYTNPPRALLALNYPLPFFDLVSRAAAENGISPYLVLGLIRQESLYDPAAVSPAQAMGLTQVIPSTAAQIASELGDADFREGDLFRPHVSIRYGAYYLGSTLEYVGGSIPAALAGYNGGPGNAARWQEQAGGDPDVFLEVIDFRETASYVELVLENYALYLYAHGLVDTPYLPLD